MTAKATAYTIQLDKAVIDPKHAQRERDLGESKLKRGKGNMIVPPAKEHSPQMFAAVYQKNDTQLDKVPSSSVVVG